MIHYITVDQVLEIHESILKASGGSAGIHDKGLLESAVEMAKMAVFGQELHITIFDKASAYLFHIVKNHAFKDGNKRTGAITTILFLEINGLILNVSESDFEDFVVEVASGKWNKEQIANYLENGHV